MLIHKKKKKTEFQTSDKLYGIKIRLKVESMHIPDIVVTFSAFYIMLCQ